MTEETKAAEEPIRITDNVFYIIAILLVTLSGLFLFGMVGLRTLFGIIAMAFPAHLLIGLFGIKGEERLIFAVFAGIALFPLAVFYLNRFVPSLRLSILLVFIVLTAAGLFVKPIMAANKQGN